MGKENTVYDEILEKFKQSSSDKFAAIATEQFNKLLKDINNNFSGQMCPDQYVGVIAYFKDKQGKITEKFPKRVNIFADETDNIGNIPNAKNILILVLESPHTDEFDENGNPIGPANGPTGRNIREHIAKIFPNFSNYHLILMNAIPFQCSLGVGTEHFRDAVFNAAWNHDAIGEEFFKGRLRVLLDKLPKNSKNVVVVNACTKGYNAAKDSDQRPFLWHLVQNSIETLNLDKEKTIQYFRINHPSSWARNKKNREIKDHRQITFPKTKK